MIHNLSYPALFPMRGSPKSDSRADDAIGQGCVTQNMFKVYEVCYASS